MKISYFLGQRLSALIIVIFAVSIQAYAQDSPCKGIPYNLEINEDGTTDFCLSHLDNSTLASFIATCYDTEGESAIYHPPIDGSCVEIPCCAEGDWVIVNYTFASSGDGAAPCTQYIKVEPCRPDCTDSDGDGVCDPDDCWPDDPAAATGLPCDDGNPYTFNDKYNDDCVCLGDHDCDDDVEAGPKEVHCDSEEDFICNIQVGVGTPFPRSSDVTNDPSFGNPLTGNVCVVGDFYIDNDFTFLDAEVNIDPDVTLFILRQGNGFGPTAKSLTLDNSHLFSCDGRWQEISVSHHASITTSHNTVIEDAVVAIRAFGNESTLAISDTRFHNNTTAIALTARGVQTAPSLIEFANNIIEEGTNGIYSVSVNILDPNQNDTNLFRNLRNGIFAIGNQNTLVWLFDQNFENITQNGIYLSNGSLLLRRCHFLDCEIRGIYVQHVAQLVDLNETEIELTSPAGDFDGITIDAFAADSRVLMDNTIINVAPTTDDVNGIVLRGGNVGDGTDIEIRGSTINMIVDQEGSPNIMEANGGIKLLGDFPPTTETRIHNNEFSCSWKMYPITSFGEMNNLNIYSNGLNLGLSNTSGPIGLYSSGGANNRIEGNNLYAPGILIPNGVSFGTSYFLRTYSFQNATYCSNSVYQSGSSIGFQFNSNNMGTVMQNNSVFGSGGPLLITGTNGEQIHNGNTWEPWTYTLGSLNVSTSTDDYQALCAGCNQVQAFRNRFEVHTEQSEVTIPTSGLFFNEFHPQLVIPDENDEFFSRTTGSPSEDCTILTPYTSTTPLGIDYSIANGNLEGFRGNNSDQWMANWYLLEKLLRQPHLIQSDPVFQAFVSLHSSTNLYKLVHSDLMMDNTDNELLQELTSNKNEIIDVLELLDSVTDVNERELLLNELDALHSIRTVLKTDYELFKAGIRNTVLAALSDISPTTEIELYEKTVRELNLKKLRGETYTVEEMESLITIASQCTSEVGMVASKAILLLPECIEFLECIDEQEYEAPETYNVITEVTNRSRDNQTGPIVYPNPNSGTFNFNLDINEVSSLQIFDLNGLSVYSTKNLVANGLNLELQAGIYTVVIELTDGKELVDKIIILD